MCQHRAMNRKRLTREDSREETRKHLLDAAQRLIAKKGLGTASVEDIAEAAGYTRGAFYSNFSSKDDLFLELLRRDHKETHVQLAALLDDSLPLDHIHTRAREIYGQMYRDSESFMNWSEARMLAARNSKFRTKLNALLTEKRSEIAGFIEYFYRRVGIAAPVPANVMAMGFMSLFEGVKLSMLSSPADMTTDNAESVLTLFIESVMQLARLQRSHGDRTDRDQIDNLRGQ
jgi:AcrR family transcriptional regulator